jgi:hypothetical protein
MHDLQGKSGCKATINNMIALAAWLGLLGLATSLARADDPPERAPSPDAPLTLSIRGRAAADSGTGG